MKWKGELGSEGFECQAKEEEHNQGASREPSKLCELGRGRSPVASSRSCLAASVLAQRPETLLGLNNKGHSVLSTPTSQTSTLLETINCLQSLGGKTSLLSRRLLKWPQATLGVPFTVKGEPRATALSFLPKKPHTTSALALEHCAESPCSQVQGPFKSLPWGSVLLSSQYQV